MANVRMVDMISVTPARVWIVVPCRESRTLRGGSGLCPPGATYQDTLCVRDAEEQRRVVHKRLYALADESSSLIHRAGGSMRVALRPNGAPPRERTACRCLPVAIARS